MTKLNEGANIIADYAAGAEKCGLNAIYVILYLTTTVGCVLHAFE